MINTKITCVRPLLPLPRPIPFPTGNAKVDAELLALEGAPSVSAALQALRETPGSETPASGAVVRAAAELLLAYVTNALRDARDPRVHRVRSGNPTFQRALGRLGGCEGVMAAIGFEPRDRGTVFVLRRMGAGGVGGGEGGCGQGKDRQEVSGRCDFVRVRIMYIQYIYIYVYVNMLRVGTWGGSTSNPL